MIAGTVLAAMVLITAAISGPVVADTSANAAGAAAVALGADANTATKVSFAAGAGFMVGTALLNPERAWGSRFDGSFDVVD